MARLLICILSLAAACALQAAEPTLSRYVRVEPHMGVEFEAVVYAAHEDQANQALGAAMARVAELDQRLSDYDLESELSKLSATSLATPNQRSDFTSVRLSADLWNVLASAQALSAATEGAFDVTTGPLTKLWRRARRWKELPDAEQLAAAKAAVGYRHLRLDASDRSARLGRPNMRLDLGGIAKGLAADEGLQAIRACGLERALVRASGDIAAGQPPPGATGWRVAIAPLDPREQPTRFLRLTNCAVSTSGDAHQHLVVDGKRYSHILDPRTGEPVAGRSSVTVVAPSGMLADSLATAASVLGPEGALALVQQHAGAELYMLAEDERGRLTSVESAGFRRFGERELFSPQ